MHLKAKITGWRKTIVSDIRQSIVGIIVGAAVVTYGGLLAISKTVLSFSIQIAKIPTPLWVTIVLALLCGVYIHLTVVRHRPLSASRNKVSKVPTKTISIEVWGFKWRANIYSDNAYVVDKMPFCPEHDLRFIYFNEFYQCPEVHSRKCNWKLPENSLSAIYDVVQSHIEKKVRNHEY